MGAGQIYPTLVTISPTPSPSCLIHGILLLQTNTLAHLLHFHLSCLLASSCLSLQTLRSLKLKHLIGVHLKFLGDCTTEMFRCTTEILMFTTETLIRCTTVQNTCQHSHSAQYNGFKLATSTFVLSILEFIFIATSLPQAFCFYHYLCSVIPLQIF